MKRYLLFILSFILFNTFSLVPFTYAEDIKSADTSVFKPAMISVKDAYFLSKREHITTEEDLMRFTIFNAYYLGIIDFYSLKLVMKNREASTCINRPVELWSDIVFDAYKENRLNGNDEFLSGFIKAIEKTCKLNILLD